MVDKATRMLSEVLQQHCSSSTCLQWTLIILETSSVETMSDHRRGTRGLGSSRPTLLARIRIESNHLLPSFFSFLRPNVRCQYETIASSVHPPTSRSLGVLKSSSRRSRIPTHECTAAGRRTGMVNGNPQRGRYDQLQHIDLRNACIDPSGSAVLVGAVQGDALLSKLLQR